MNEKIKHILKNRILLIAIVIVSVVGFRQFFTPVIVSGNSMNPTLTDGTLAISCNYNKSDDIERGTIIVAKTSDYYIIKRVIGLPGETISCKDDTIYINGIALKDDYSDIETYDFGETVIGNDEYFVLGDNRTNSKDSRSIGAIKKSEILCTNLFVITPITSFGVK